ncbi:MAG: hypothetical protein KKE30_07060 [Gammaproteobacteria bacterium]|nr:hypothetical protein [Gammaproteobacteria bacterium]MBU1556233.1 hypothetical protein [Gammaproteobacteria bacterium]MBU2071553.1 hypothetical protein [Gammaproteobacteria bacterium]MBU2184043.1 hypothetical protein [Gammaproteobacteria bacterium]MBU2206871.1 hypothetical protein [Gammaproteobacteria bacterium]
MDKNYLTPPSSLPPQHVRAMLSELSNSALAYEDYPVDATEVLATLNKLLVEPYYRSKLAGKDTECSAEFIQLIRYDLANTCHWWEESWRFEASWPIIERIGLQS